MAEMTYTETLIVTHCWCGIALAIPETLFKHAKQTEKNHVYCPIGHTFVFGSTWERKAREAEEAKARSERRELATRDLLRAEERSHTATRGHLTRARKRAAAGVCPCCNRHFENVQRHVERKHPDFDPNATP